MNDFLMSCRFLAKTCIWCVVFSVVGSVILVLVSLTMPTSLWHMVIFVLLAPALLGICVILWAVSRMPGIYETRLSKDNDVLESTSFGGTVMLASTAYCVLYYSYGPFVLFVILNMIYGN